MFYNLDNKENEEPKVFENGKSRRAHEPPKIASAKFIDILKEKLDTF